MKHLLLLAFLLFIFINILIVGPGGLSVIQTGMCPAAPTDIPPYPCSIFEYLARMLFGPWALPGQIVLFIVSVLLSSVVIGVGKFIWNPLRRRIGNKDSNKHDTN